MNEPANVDEMNEAEYLSWLSEQNPALLNKKQLLFLMVGTRSELLTETLTIGSPTWNSSYYGRFASWRRNPDRPEDTPPLPVCPSCLRSMEDHLKVAEIGTEDQS